MQRESTSKPETSKARSASEVTLESASVWKQPAAGAKRPENAPPPDWTRYIDSRLKQFCTR